MITLGHKGKFIGVVGVYKTGKPAEPFRFRVPAVEMTEDFLTPKDKEKGHPIVELMETYTKDLRDKGYLEKYGQVRHALQVMPEVEGLRNPGTVTYVGSDKCKKCHKARLQRLEGNEARPRLPDAGRCEAAEQPPVRSGVHRLPHGRLRLPDGLHHREAQRRT